MSVHSWHLNVISKLNHRFNATSHTHTNGYSFKNIISTFQIDSCVRKWHLIFTHARLHIISLDERLDFFSRACLFIERIANRKETLNLVPLYDCVYVKWSEKLGRPSKLRIFLCQLIFHPAPIEERMFCLLWIRKTKWEQFRCHYTMRRIYLFNLFNIRYGSFCWVNWMTTAIVCAENSSWMESIVLIIHYAIVMSESTNSSRLKTLYTGL